MLKTINSDPKEVSRFLDGLQHPMRKEIDSLRAIILSADAGLRENIKWNGPNYTFKGEDRITMRIQPPKQLQLIFHRGAKKIAQPAHRLIDHVSPLLSWKAADRAVITFTSMHEIVADAAELQNIVQKWIAATANK